MKFGNIVRIKPHDISKVTTLRKKVLAAKHMASLQLLCTAGGNRARLDARMEFKVLELLAKGGGSWSCTGLYLCSRVTYINLKTIIK